MTEFVDYRALSTQSLMKQLDTDTGNEDVEDIMQASLETLYGFKPIAHSSPGSLWTHTSSLHPDVTCTLRTPNPRASNWNLHASSIWVGAVYLADCMCEDPSVEFLHPSPSPRLLEIGAGAGLPGIVLSKLKPEYRITLSDYPDEGILEALRENVARNGVGGSIPVVTGFDWRSSPPPELCEAFDAIIGADTLWNSDLHRPMLSAMERCLKKDTDARVTLVAGLHTGRYTIARFLELVSPDCTSQLKLERVEERQVGGEEVRDWSADREDSEKDRRDWVVWIELRRRWPNPGLH